MIVVELRDLHVTYRSGRASIEALRGVNLRLTGPGLVLLMGPNGSGKTTLLKAIAGLVKYRGAVKITDTEGVDNKVQVTYIPVGGILIDELTVKETLMLASNGDAAKVREALLKLGLSHVADREVYRLSTGERRRVELAIALVKGGRIILIDEPTIGLDEDNVRGVALILRGMAKGGSLVIAATHDNELVGYADEVYYIRGGVIEGRMDLRAVRSNT